MNTEAIVDSSVLIKLHSTLEVVFARIKAIE